MEKRRWVFMVGVVAVTYLLFQSLLLPYENALRSLLPDGEIPVRAESSFRAVHSVAKSVMVRNPLKVYASELSNDSMVVEVVKNEGVRRAIGEGGGLERKDSDVENGFASDVKGLDNDFELFVDGNLDSDSPPYENVVHVSESLALEVVRNEENSSVLDEAGEGRLGVSLEQIVKPNNGVSVGKNPEENTSLKSENSKGVDTTIQSPPLAMPRTASSITITYLENVVSNASSSALQRDGATLKNDSVMMTSTGTKKMRCNMPPKSITSLYEMNRILLRHRRSMRPRRSSVRDQEIVAVKSHIEHAPVVINNPELYAPLFRNVSMFKRSYELMERTLKVYVYRDGSKPIFHQPILKGLYASEGWFMKLMEGNKRFVVKDPRKAHLFYMPFSSRMLEYTLYVRNSHNQTNLWQYLKDYSEKIAAKYPYWNRTGGADHFLVACHDWAPYETRHHMEHCIKALCNADVTAGFKIGRDVSLPETYVRAARNPLRDLGGKPPSHRHILAFYAGNMHGYLRPILLKYWKDKDPDMKIFGPMPTGVASKMNYIQHMKSSKYCICPKGYEVNSPRVVEAIFYECVPVIISDNFVPPFFEVLDWGAFSLIVAEKDISNLKDILLSIPKEKYLELQLGVRKVQKHFLWHAKPLKYDLFHMTLHSIWYNRVFQIKLR
ncbi:probable glycosyltransferase At5g03795 [Alnus glutinosa]|uniref:probable glycosyltransferase At5g03795 n=1 Tax=Alnus glutinosa TaxID=3517 RepID=UPI002D7803B0|nr:probable glycosyltransferase At5g03795 [Alnus glutinosa]XP_062149068.1 probable glycosyltransferase At5g03795 [Alnus glutinosa]